MMKFLVLALLPAALAGGIPGGITDTTVDPNYEPVVFAANLSSTFLYNTDGSDHYFVKVVKARTQIVEGEKLYLTLQMSGSYYCDVTVWYRKWLKGNERLQETAFDCRWDRQLYKSMHPTKKDGSAE